MTQVADHDAYIAHAPEDMRSLLAKLRRQLAKVLPGAEEAIAYNMPEFRIGKATVAGYAGFSKQCRLYVSPVAIKTHADAPAEAGLTPSKTGVAFSPGRPIPNALVKKRALGAEAEACLLALHLLHRRDHCRDHALDILRA